MTLQQLKEQLNKYYKFDISERNRQREYSYARKVYCKLAREIGYTYQALGKEIGLKHDAALYHAKDFKVVAEQDKNIYNKIILQNNLDVELCKTKKIPTFNPDTIKTKKPKTYKEALINDIIDTIGAWNDETINNFIHTRLTPYNRLIETTKPQKKVEEVKGATLNRPVKNPVLC